MTDQLNSQLSAFVDDALSAEEGELLVRRLCRDSQLRETLARYALIGDAARRGETAAAPPDFARRVMMAVEGQPLPAPVVTPAARSHGRQFGFAVAASVLLAAVALMTLPGRAPGPDAAPVQTAAVVNPPPLAPVETGPALTPVAALMGPQPPLPRPDAVRLNNYLVQHVSVSRPGVVAYRNVGYGTQPELRR